MFGYDHEANLAAETLDEFDFSDFIKLCLVMDIRDPYVIAAGLISWYNDPYLTDALDTLTIKQFMQYIEDQYDVVFEEEIRYKMKRDISYDC